MNTNMKIINSKIKKRTAGHLILLSVCAAMMLQMFCACQKTEYTDVWEDRYTDQQVDTVGVRDNWYLTDHIVRTAADLGTGRQLQAVSICTDGDALYVANEKGGSVDVFDLETMNFRRSMSNGSRTTAHDVCVEGNHVFVAAGNMREVQIFDKTSGAYLTRLGTGVYTGNVSWAGCVAASSRFVFVRDSKERNIRVFDRNAIALDKTDNNTVYARLSTESHFIGSQTEPNSDAYDMAVIGDSLYAFLHRPGLVYAYALRDIETLKDATPLTKTTLPAGMKIYSAAKDDQRRSVWLAMVRDGKTLLEEFAMADFQKRDFSNPLRQFAAGNRLALPAQPIIAFHNETLTWAAGPNIERWSIVNVPSYIIRPREKK